MKIQSVLFGEIEYNPDHILTFPKGLVSFENSQRYLVVHESAASDTDTFTLQSLDDPALAFQVIDPAALGFNYELALDDAESTLLQSPNATDVAVLLLVFRQENAAKEGVGANFRAPLIINTQARVGLQKIIDRLRPNITLSNLSV